MKAFENKSFKSFKDSPGYSKTDSTLSNILTKKKITHVINNRIVV